MGEGGRTGCAPASSSARKLLHCCTTSVANAGLEEKASASSRSVTSDGTTRRSIISCTTLRVTHPRALSNTLPGVQLQRVVDTGSADWHCATGTVSLVVWQGHKLKHQEKTIQGHTQAQPLCCYMLTLLGQHRSCVQISSRRTPRPHIQTKPDR